MAGITASVGLGGQNRRSDVLVVQALLEAAGVSPGVADGRCGRLTIHAIERFQAHILRRPDGRVDVHGPTIARLVARPARPPIRSSGSNGQPTSSDMFDRKTPSRVAPARPVAAPSPRPAAVPQASAFWRQRTVLPGGEVNAGVVCPSGAQMMQLLGDPTHPAFRARIATESVGPFRATGLKPALAGLRAVLSQVHHDLPDLYGLLGSNGMHVVRRITNGRGYSNHAWGIAIDFLIANDAPAFGVNASSRGLDAMVPYFHKAGWYWGGGYRSAKRKDAMHFECGLALVRGFAG